MAATKTGKPITQISSALSFDSTKQSDAPEPEQLLSPDGGYYLDNGAAVTAQIGTSAGLRLGKVMAVSQGEVNERYPWLSNDRVTVWGIDDDHLSYYKYHKDEPHSDWARPKPNSKKSTLLFSSRCVVVPEEYVPEPYRRMIEDKINETYEG